MSKQIIHTNIRLNLAKDADRRAWERLHQMDRTTYKSYSQVFVMAINDFFDRQEQLADDPFLESREKEDVFLRSVLETISQGLQNSAPAVQASPSPTATKRNDIPDAAMDFVDSF